MPENTLFTCSIEEDGETLFEVDRAWDPPADMRVMISKTEKMWKLFLRLPYEPMIAVSNSDHSPEVGAAWRLNLHRVASREGDHDFLSWRPAYVAVADSFLFENLIFLGAA